LPENSKYPAENVFCSQHYRSNNYKLLSKEERSRKIEVFERSEFSIFRKLLTASEDNLFVAEIAGGKRFSAVKCKQR